MRITSATALLAPGFRGPSALYAVCQIPGSARTKIETHVVKGSPSPTWDTELVVAEYNPGDALEFKVLDKDPKNPVVIGSVTFLASAFQAAGFEGEVLLEGAAAGLKPYLKVSIAGPDGRFPAEAPLSTTFEVVFPSKPLGIEGEVDDVMSMIRIRRLAEGCGIAQHNAAAAQHEQIAAGDYIVAANGLIDRSAIKSAVQDARQVVLTIRPTIAMAKSIELPGQTLGMELKFNKKTVGEPDVVVLKVKAGSPLTGVLQRGDRLTSVNGSGSLDHMLDQLKRGSDLPRFSFDFKRPRPFPSSGPVDVSALSRLATNDRGLLAQPQQPSAETLLVQIFIRGRTFGGPDKSSSGHRYDSIAIANGVINAGMSCQLVHYLHEEHDSFVDVCKKFKAVIVRCAPGQIKADGGDQKRFDQALGDLKQSGVLIWPSPAVVEPLAAEEDQWIAGSSSTCADMVQCLAACCTADAPTANFCDIRPVERAEAKRLGDLLGLRIRAFLEPATL